MSHRRSSPPLAVRSPPDRPLGSLEGTIKLLNVTAKAVLARPSSLQVHQFPLHLAFPKNLKTPIHILNGIVFTDNSPVSAELIPNNPTVHLGTTVPFPIKIELVVLDGDFPPLHQDADDKTWTAEEFQSWIIKERKGKPLLLVGDLVATLQPDGGAVASFGEVKFTDNSSWVRSGKFKLEVRVIPRSSGSGAVKIREAASEEFIVQEKSASSIHRCFGADGSTSLSP